MVKGKRECEVLVEGAKRTIVILNGKHNLSHKIYTIIRDSSCHGFDIINQPSPQSLHKLLPQKHIYLLIVSGVNYNVCEKTIAQVHSVRPDLPMLFIYDAIDSKIDDLVKQHGYASPLLVENLDVCTLLEEIFSSIERAKISHQVKTREAILQAVNFAAESFLNNPDWKVHIKEVLQKIAEASGADHVSVFNNNYDDRGQLVKAQRIDCWMDADIQHVHALTPGMNYDVEQIGDRNFVKTLKDERFIQFHVRELPRKARPLFHLNNVKSSLYISVYTNGDWWGYLRFDQCKIEREWDPIEIEALQTAANILSAAIDRQKTDERLKYLATHDYLTDLPNRILFEDHLQQALLRSQRSKKWVGIYMLDLDHFKKVNDKYGHPFGDKVLKEVSKRLQRAIRASDTVARIGGDEFVVVGEELTSFKDVGKVGEKLLAVFQDSIICDNKSVHVRPSIGVSIYPNDSEDEEELMRLADIALYKAKENGNIFVVYEESPGKQLWLDNLQK